MMLRVHEQRPSLIRFSGLTKSNKIRIALVVPLLASIQHTYADTEDEIWLSSMDSTHLIDLMTETPTTDKSAPMPVRKASQGHTCSKQLTSQLQNLPVNINTASHRTLCEIISVEVEWDLRLQQMQQFYQTIPLDVYMQMSKTRY